MNCSIVFQGPTTYCDQVLKNFSSKCETIYSTWFDEPKENLEFIESKVSKLILNEYPEYVGKNNINKQCVSTKNGILAANNEFIFKSRTDILFSNVDLLMQKIASSHIADISFLCYYTFATPHQITDFFSYGSKEESLKFWDYTQKPNQSFPNYPDPECPERQLILNYMSQKGKNDINEFLKNSNYFANHLNKDNCDLIWLKHNQSLFEGWARDLKDNKTPNLEAINLI